jgi:hypothetical protein
MSGSVLNQPIRSININRFFYEPFRNGEKAGLCKNSSVRKKVDAHTVSKHSLHYHDYRMV